jgi:nicotinate phosphoribosyltransferase
MSQYPHFQGTSNMRLARKYGCKMRGTFPHEWPQRISALESLRHANRYAMKIWQKVFGARLGIALPDTFGTDSFLRDFDDSLARLFDGVRHDSGDPIEFAMKIIAHYKSLGIDPTTKIIVFSDSLNIEKVLQIEKALDGLIRRSYGIGTFLTNDYPGSPALNMVIKMIMCDGICVVKLSDSPTKAIGDYDALRVAAYTHLDVPLDSGMYDHLNVAK